MKAPRWYQAEAVEASFAYLYAHPSSEKVPLVALPTGTGKALCIAGSCLEAWNRWPGVRILMVSHSANIVGQNKEELEGIWPAAPLGIHCDDLGRRETHNPIIFGTMQSVWATIKKHGVDVFGPRMLVFIDEAHIVSPKENTTYQNILRALRQVYPGLRIIGYTATPWRLGQGRLTDGGLFTDVCYDKTGLEDFNEFIRQGFLVPLFPQATETEINLEGVSLVGGEFNQKELAAASNVERVTVNAVREMLRLAHNRRWWLIFTAGIEHTESTTAILNMHGVDADFVHHKRKDNADVIRRYKEGRFQALVNANMLTTGFNVPWIDHIGMLCATNSVVRHVQSLGRGTRPWENKSSCLVTDFARNVARLGPINDPVIPAKPGQRKGMPAPAKLCKNCGMYNHTSARLCFVCANPFEFDPNFHESAGTSKVIAGLESPIVEVWPIDHVHYRAHTGGSGKPTMQVTYISGAKVVSEWVSLEHKGYPRVLAKQWWSVRSDSYECPPSVELALRVTTFLKQPKSVTVKLNPGQRRAELIGVNFQ